MESSDYYGPELPAIASVEERIAILRRITDDSSQAKGARRYAASILAKMGEPADMLDRFPIVPRSFTKADYATLFEAQDGECAICHRTPTKPLVVDHDHHTGVVRGLLCTSCNTGLGALGDDVDSLRAAVTYLEAHRQR